MLVWRQSSLGGSATMPTMLSNLNSAIGQARLAVRVREMLGIAEDPNVTCPISPHSPAHSDACAHAHIKHAALHAHALTICIESS